MGKCPECGNLFKDRNIGKINQRKFCCWKHQELYSKRINGRKYASLGLIKKPSKETLKKSVKKHYENNKYQYKSRWITLKFFKINNIKKDKCKLCGSKNCEIHHEIYPLTLKETEKAFNGGKIYFLCKKCHGKTRRIKEFS